MGIMAWIQSKIMGVLLVGLLILGILIGIQSYVIYRKNITINQANIAKGALGEKNNQLTGDLERLREVNRLLTESGKITEKIIETVTIEIDRTKDSTEFIERTIAARVRSIEQKYKDREQTQATIASKEREISEQRLIGIWSIFCLSNSTHEYCHQFTTAKKADTHE